MKPPGPETAGVAMVLVSAALGALGALPPPPPAPPPAPPPSPSAPPPPCPPPPSPLPAHPPPPVPPVSPPPPLPPMPEGGYSPPKPSPPPPSPPSWPPHSPPPRSPGSRVVANLIVTFYLSGASESFNSTSFLIQLSKLISVSLFRMTQRVQSGSVIVTVTILEKSSDASGSDASLSEVSNALLSASIASLSTSLGASVVTQPTIVVGTSVVPAPSPPPPWPSPPSPPYPPPSPPPPALPPPTPFPLPSPPLSRTPSKPPSFPPFSPLESLSVGAAIGIGVAAGCVVTCIIGLCLLARRRGFPCRGCRPRTKTAVVSDYAPSLEAAQLDRLNIGIDSSAKNRTQNSSSADPLVNGAGTQAVFTTVHDEPGRPVTGKSRVDELELVLSSVLEEEVEALHMASAHNDGNAQIWNSEINRPLAAPDCVQSESNPLVTPDGHKVEPITHSFTPNQPSEDPTWHSADPPTPLAGFSPLGETSQPSTDPSCPPAAPSHSLAELSGPPAKPAQSSTALVLTKTSRSNAAFELIRPAGLFQKSLAFCRRLVSFCSTSAEDKPERPIATSPKDTENLSAANADRPLASRATAIHKLEVISESECQAEEQLIEAGKLAEGRGVPGEVSKSAMDDQVSTSGLAETQSHERAEASVAGTERGLSSSADVYSDELARCTCTDPVVFQLSEEADARGEAADNIGQESTLEESGDAPGIDTVVSSPELDSTSPGLDSTSPENAHDHADLHGVAGVYAPAQDVVHAGVLPGVHPGVHPGDEDGVHVGVHGGVHSDVHTHAGAHADADVHADVYTDLNAGDLARNSASKSLLGSAAMGADGQQDTPRMEVREALSGLRERTHDGPRLSQEQTRGIYQKRYQERVLGKLFTARVPVMSEDGLKSRGRQV